LFDISPWSFTIFLQKAEKGLTAALRGKEVLLGLEVAELLSFAEALGVLLGPLSDLLLELVFGKPQFVGGQLDLDGSGALIDFEAQLVGLVLRGEEVGGFGV